MPERETKPGEDGPFHEPPRDGARRGRGESARRVLLVENDPLVSATTTAMLERIGWEVTLAATGPAAIDALRIARNAQQPFAVVLLDLFLAGPWDGVDTFGKLREVDPAVRAVLATGDPTLPPVRSHRRLGFAGLLSKPYRLQALRVALDLACAPTLPESEEEA